MTTLWQKIETFFTTEVEPALAGFFHLAEPAVIDALTPLASAAVQEEYTALSSSVGNLGAFATASGSILANLASKAEAAGVEATGAALLQTATAAIAAIQPPTVTATVTPAPIPTPAPPPSE